MSSINENNTLGIKYNKLYNNWQNPLSQGYCTIFLRATDA